MANHVSSHLWFSRINTKAKEKLAMMLKWNELSQENGRLENFHELMEHSPDQPDYNWYHDHIGPKWCHFEDYDLDTIHTESAWGWPDKGFAWLINELRKEDPFLLAECRYEDEAPNFYGVAAWGPAGFEDYYIDIREGMESWKAQPKEYDFIIPHIPAEDDDWNDQFVENIWEAVHTHQDQLWFGDVKGDVELDDGLLYDENGFPLHQESYTWGE
jgi:hypothetical protein